MDELSDPTLELKKIVYNKKKYIYSVSALREFEYLTGLCVLRQFILWARKSQKMNNDQACSMFIILTFPCQRHKSEWQTKIEVY